MWQPPASEHALTKLATHVCVHAAAAEAVEYKGDLLNTSYYPTSADAANTNKEWFVINAEGQTLGRLASLAATYIRWACRAVRRDVSKRSHALPCNMPAWEGHASWAYLRVRYQQLQRCTWPSIGLTDAMDMTRIQPSCSSRGKHQATYSPSMDMGAYVVVINAEKAVVSGNKFTDKKYFSHVTGRPGSYRLEAFKDLQAVSD